MQYSRCQTCPTPALAVLSASTDLNVLHFTFLQLEEGWALTLGSEQGFDTDSVSILGRSRLHPCVFLHFRIKVKEGAVPQVTPGAGT